MNISLPAFAVSRYQREPIRGDAAPGREISREQHEKIGMRALDRGEKTKEDAVKVELSQSVEKIVTEPFEHPYTPPLRRAAKEAQKLEIPIQVDAEPQPAPGLFESGKEVSGSFADGKITTNTGATGSYEELRGGQIRFEIGKYKGIIMPNNKAVVFNQESKETMIMDFDKRSGKFLAKNIQPLSTEPFVPGDKKPLVDESERNGFKWRIGENGMVQMKLEKPDGTSLIGRGFLDKNGTMVLALNNGATVKAHYTLEDGVLKIFDRSAIG